MHGETRAHLRDRHGRHHPSRIQRDRAQPIQVGHDVQLAAVGRKRGAERVSSHGNGAALPQPGQVDDRDLFRELIGHVRHAARGAQHDRRGRTPRRDGAGQAERCELEALDRGRVHTCEIRRAICRDGDVERVAGDEQPLREDGGGMSEAGAPRLRPAGLASRPARPVARRRRRDRGPRRGAIRAAFPKTRQHRREPGAPDLGPAQPGHAVDQAVCDRRIELLAPRQLEQGAVARLRLEHPVQHAGPSRQLLERGQAVAPQAAGELMAVSQPDPGGDLVCRRRVPVAAREGADDRSAGGRERRERRLERVGERQRWHRSDPPQEVHPNVPAGKAQARTAPSRAQYPAAMPSLRGSEPPAYPRGRRMIAWAPPKATAASDVTS